MVFICFVVAPLICRAQEFSFAVRNGSPEGVNDPPGVLDLQRILGIERYTATFTMPDTLPHDILLVMRSIHRDGNTHADTLINTAPWKKKVLGGFPWDPRSGATFMVQELDSTHIKLYVSMGSSMVRTLVVPWPNLGYSLNEGVYTGFEQAKRPYGSPIPIMVLTQPYPDPPPPKQAVVHRYCFGSQEHPAQWPAIYGVPHLYVFELTVLP
jgi:hypothetical protein